MSNRTKVTHDGPGPVIVVKPRVFTDTTVRVSDEGELVTLAVGHDGITMHYEDAIRISQMLRLHAKRAKRRAGDQSRHWSAVGIVTDLSQKE